jgi:putative NADH-flavin reductase
MRLLIAGASGRTGRILVDLALAHGHEVTALVRDRSRYREPSSRVRVVAGDVLILQTLAAAVEGQEAIVSVLSPRPRTNGRVYVEGTRNLAQAALDAGVRRLVVVSAEGAGVDERELSLFYRLVLRIPVVARLYPDIARMETELRARTDLDWTVVRPPLLTNHRAKDTYREVVGPDVPGGLWLPRADLAAYLLELVETGRHLHESVSVAS